MLISSSTSSSGTQVTRGRLPSQLGRGSEAPKSSRGGGAHLVGWAIKQRAGRGGAARGGARGSPSSVLDAQTRDYSWAA